MKILELAEFYSNYSGNFVPSLAKIEEKANDSGHSVIFVFSSKNMNKFFLDWEVPFSNCHQTILMNFQSKSFVNDVVALIRKEKIDVVHAHFMSSKNLSSIKKRSPSNVSFFQHIHNDHSQDGTLYTFLKRIRNYLFLDHNIIKIPTAAGISKSVQYLFPGSKVIPCLNAIDFSRLQEKDHNEVGKFNILLFGYNYFVKGVDLAIKAVGMLDKKMNAELDIVMGDHLEENTERIKKEFGEIPSFVKILPPTKDVVGLYQSHQIFLTASRSEGFCFAINEAYFCGALIVSSDLAPIKEVGLPGIVLFSPNNIDGLCSALTTAFEKRITYRNDVEYVKKRLSLDAWAIRILKILGVPLKA